MTADQIIPIFSTQQAYKYTLRKQQVEERKAKLKQLKANIKINEALIYAALQSDLRKSTFESAVTELLFVYAELDYAIKNLSSWARPKRIGKTLSNPFAKNRLYYEPKGVCLIIAPWNYPFQLVMSPLVSAIAAGNCVMVKPSELSPATTKVVAKIIAETFETHEVACFEGDVEVSSALLKLPFDHIFFTGSTAVGKIVMEAAAKNLSSVTLELGGKSPTVIDETANLEKAANKIAWGKLVNSGQTCIAPDYVFVHEQQVDQFVRLYKAAAHKMYFNTPESVNPKAYGKIINAKHFERLNHLVSDAVEKGATINWGGTTNAQTQTIDPVILTQVPSNAQIMEDEIFGPILPIVTYTNLAEVIDQINAKSKPLALYIFSESSTNTNYMIKNTSAGGTCVNDVLVHIANPKLPFGGVNGSGLGSSHGFYGFKNFSHERAIVFQRKIDFNSMVYPPYVGKEWVLKMLGKLM